MYDLHHQTLKNGRQDCGGGQAQGEMCDSQLILDGTEFIVCGLFSFSIAEAGEVSLNFGTQGVSFFKKGSIPLNLRAGIGTWLFSCFLQSRSRWISFPVWPHKEENRWGRDIYVHKLIIINNL